MNQEMSDNSNGEAVLQFSERQPKPLFNNSCHTNSLWYARKYGLEFCWAIASNSDHSFVHAVCLDSSGYVVDPSLGDYGREVYKLARIDHPPPRSYAEAAKMLQRLNRQYNKRGQHQKKWWHLDKSAVFLALALLAMCLSIIVLCLRLPK